MLLEAETNKYCPGGYDIGAISNLITWVLNFFLSACWLGRVSFSGEVGRYIVLPMFAWKGVLFWRGGQVYISAHVGWEEYPYQGRVAGRYFCPCWLGSVSFCRKVEMLIFLPMWAWKCVLL